MPVVGKKYRNTMIREPYSQETRVIDFDDKWIFVKHEASAQIGKLLLADFKDHWEEVPESNKAETSSQFVDANKKVASAEIEQVQKSGYIETGNDYVFYMRDLPLSSNDKYKKMTVLSAIDEDSAEIAPTENAVEKAKEKLREEINFLDPLGRKILSVEDYYRLKTAAQALLDALEAEKKDAVKHGIPVGFINAFHAGYAERDKEIAAAKNWFPKEPTLDRPGIKLAKSIWRDVRELSLKMDDCDNDQEEYLGRFTTNKEYICRIGLRVNFYNARVSEYCSLTDLINHIEARDKEFEKLEERVEEIYSKMFLK